MNGAYVLTDVIGKSGDNFLGTVPEGTNIVLSEVNWRQVHEHGYGFSYIDFVFTDGS